MTTNLPAKMATAMVVPAAAAAEMVVVRSGRRIWMWRWSQSLWRNDATSMIAIMELLATRWQKRGGGGSMAAAPRQQWWWQQRGGGSSVVVAAAWQ